MPGGRGRRGTWKKRFEIFAFSNLLRENLISAAIEEYTVSGMNQLLSLRLKGLAQVLPATVFYSVNQSLDLDKLTELTEQIQLVPLLIPVDRDASSYHWVGLVIKKGTNNVAIAYLDSENDLISITRERNE